MHMIMGCKKAENEPLLVNVSLTLGGIHTDPNWCSAEVALYNRTSPLVSDIIDVSCNTSFLIFR